ncbi:uncharacterized protein PAC_05590 [Phialocephala subalpina]|uniref:Uncharacterized protein n=1 Tax=Phialocephala subalpina TaxID=576137 RepID=A0A1L7WSF2_9HELO|nr:uncharacterized protein PAC_05590 [Phialocephala subalpina]
MRFQRGFQCPLCLSNVELCRVRSWAALTRPAWLKLQILQGCGPMNSALAAGRRICRWSQNLPLVVESAAGRKTHCWSQNLPLVAELAATSCATMSIPLESVVQALGSTSAESCDQVGELVTLGLKISHVNLEDFRSLGPGKLLDVIKHGHYNNYPEDRIEGFFATRGTFALIVLVLAYKAYGDNVLLGIAALEHEYRIELLEFIDKHKTPTHSINGFIEDLKREDAPIPEGPPPKLGNRVKEVFLRSTPSKVKSYEERRSTKKRKLDDEEDTPQESSAAVSAGALSPNRPPSSPNSGRNPKVLRRHVADAQQPSPQASANAQLLPPLARLEEMQTQPQLGGYQNSSRTSQVGESQQGGSYGGLRVGEYQYGERLQGMPPPPLDLSYLGHPQGFAAGQNENDTQIAQSSPFLTNIPSGYRTQQSLRNHHTSSPVYATNSQLALPQFRPAPLPPDLQRLPYHNSLLPATFLISNDSIEDYF